MARNGTIEILGAPFVFARRKLRKPKHTEPVRMVCRPVLCHNACGLFYVAPSDAEMKRGDVCPDCGAPPKPWRIGAAEEIEVAVHMAFGNLVDLTFLRSLGPLSQRVVNAPVSRARVAAPSGRIVLPRAK